MNYISLKKQEKVIYEQTTISQQKSFKTNQCIKIQNTHRRINDRRRI